MHVASLGPGDRQRVEQFSCAGGSKNYWTLEIEAIVRQQLPWYLEHPDESNVEALGLFEGQDLCAVAAWSPTTEAPGISQHHVLAVRNGRKRRGYGERLLREVLERAKAAGADAVVSLIHAENEPMLRLSGRFGAETSTDPRDLDYRLCTIPL